MQNLSTIIISASPKKLNTCRQCGVELDVLAEMLGEPSYTDDHALACSILENCATCRSHFTVKDLFKGRDE